MTRKLSLTSLTLLLALSSHARAETFVLNYAKLPVAADPAQDFETDCLGASEAEDCALRAALLEAELVEILASLEGNRDAETVAVFQSTVNSGSPQLAQLGLRYFARQQNLPSGLWGKVKELFFGPDPNVGQPSAELLRNAQEPLDRALSDVYREARPHEAYSGDAPQSFGAKDEWAEAQAKDALWNAVQSFSEEELFPSASRLLMIDRFISKLSDASVQIPVTGFVTDAQPAEVIAHFSRIFGTTAYRSLNQTRLRSEALTVQLLELQQRLLEGDSSAKDLLEEVAAELEAANQSMRIATALQLENLGCADDVYFSDNTPSGVLTEPLRRAVSVGTDALLERTTIRYFAAQGTFAVGDGDAGDDDGDSPDVTPPDKGGKKSGGGCSIGAQPGSARWLLVCLAACFSLSRLSRGPGRRPR